MQQKLSETVSHRRIINISNMFMRQKLLAAAAQTPSDLRLNFSQTFLNVFKCTQNAHKKVNVKNELLENGSRASEFLCFGQRLV